MVSQPRPRLYLLTDRRQTHQRPLASALSQAMVEWDDFTLIDWDRTGVPKALMTEE